MAIDTEKKLRIYTSIAGDLDIETTLVVPSAGTATDTVFQALTGMADAGFIPIKHNGIEYLIPILQKA